MANRLLRQALQQKQKINMEREEAATRSLKRFGQGVYFHYTSWRNANSIIKSNRLVLSPTIANSSEERNTTKKYSFYASFARTMQNAFFSHIRGAVIVFDAQKLKSRYEIKPVDYWERMWLRSREVTLNPSNFVGRESEDRLFSAKPIIPLPINSIKEVHATYDTREDLPKLVAACKKLKIPVYVHRNEKTVHQLSVRAEDHVPVSEIVSLERERAKKYRGQKPYGGMRNYDRNLKAILNVYHAKKYYDLTKETRSVVSWWNGGDISASDFANSLSADIGNSKSLGSEGDKKKIARIILIMRKHKLDYRSLYNYLYEKYSRLRDEYYAAKQTEHKRKFGAVSAIIKPLYATVYLYEGDTGLFFSTDKRSFKLSKGKKYALYSDDERGLYLIGSMDRYERDVPSYNFKTLTKKVYEEILAMSATLNKSAIFTERDLNLKSRAPYSEHSSAKPVDHKLYEKFIKKAKKKFEKWPSRVATWWVVRQYKKAGGEFSKATPARNYNGYNWVEGDVLTTERERIQQIKARIASLNNTHKDKTNEHI